MALHRIMIFAVLCLVGFFAFQHYSEQRVNALQARESQAEPLAPVTITAKPTLPKPAPSKPQLAKQPSAASNNATEQLPQFHCRWNSKGAVKKTQGQKIYKWKDANGKTHFSDAPPASAPQTVKTITTKGVDQYFKLHLHEGDKPLPVEYRERLNVRIRKAYHVMATWIPRKYLQQVKVNLHIFDTRASYEAFRKKHAPGLGVTTSGFHSTRKNIAASLYRNDAQLLRTSLHEAVHVMNAAMLGNLPRWMNEGIAEYFEHMDVYGQATEIPPHTYWLKIIEKQPLPLTRLFPSVYKMWQQPEMVDSLYAHSWATVFFLMSSPSRKALLTQYMTQQTRAPCQRLNPATFFASHYPGGLTKLQSDFNYWKALKPQAHRY